MYESKSGPEVRDFFYNFVTLWKVPPVIPVTPVSLIIVYRLTMSFTLTNWM